MGCREAVLPAMGWCVKVWVLGDRVDSGGQACVDAKPQAAEGCTREGNGVSEDLCGQGQRGKGGAVSTGSPTGKDVSNARF